MPMVLDWRALCICARAWHLGMPVYQPKSDNPTFWSRAPCAGKTAEERLDMRSAGKSDKFCVSGVEEALTGCCITCHWLSRLLLLQDANRFFATTATLMPLFAEMSRLGHLARLSGNEWTTCVLVLYRKYMPPGTAVCDSISSRSCWVLQQGRGQVNNLM